MDEAVTARPVTGVCADCGRPPAGRWRISLHGELNCTTHPVRAQCAFCGRTAADPAPPGWRPFGDGMSRCPRCLSGAIETQADVRRHLPGIRRDMAAVGLVLPDRVRVRLVGYQQAAALIGGRPGGLLIGLTERVVTDGGGGGSVTISVVEGLNPTYFGRAVSHEMGHAWLALHASEPDDPLEEGLCELFAYAWLKRVGTPMAQQLRRLLLDNPDPVYGGGFRTVHAAVQRHGVGVTLDSLARAQRLP